MMHAHFLPHAARGERDLVRVVVHDVDPIPAGAAIWHGLANDGRRDAGHAHCHWLARQCLARRYHSSNWLVPVLSLVLATIALMAIPRILGKDGPVDARSGSRYVAFLDAFRS